MRPRLLPAFRLRRGRPPASGLRRLALAAGLRRLALAAGLLLAATSPGTAQTGDLGRVKLAFPGATGERIAALIQEAGAQGLPTALLVGKALEGAQKHVPPEQVLEAVAGYARELREAHAAVGGEVEDEALKEAADALRRGVPPSAIRSLARGARGDLSILFVVMLDLMDEGVPAGSAEALVEDAIRRGVSGERLLSLPASVHQLIRGGLSPADAAESVRREIGGGQAWLPGVRWQGRRVGWPYAPPSDGGFSGTPRP